MNKLYTFINIQISFLAVYLWTWEQLIVLKSIIISHFTPNIRTTKKHTHLSVKSKIILELTKDLEN